MKLEMESFLPVIRLFCLYFSITFTEIETSDSNYYSFSKTYSYDSVYSTLAAYTYSPIIPQIQPAAYGLVKLPYAHVTRYPPNPADKEYPYHGGINTVLNTTASPTACRSSTYRTNLGCPCNLIGQACFVPQSRCLAAAGGGGLCGCVSGYIAFNFTCLSTDDFQNITGNFSLLAPVLTASCFLPANAPVGNIPQVGANGTIIWTLTLLNSSPTSSSTSYIKIESSTGNLLLVSPPPVGTVPSQTYSVYGTDASGVSSNVITFTILYQCTAPTVSFDLGNNFIVDCTRVSVGDVIVTAVAANTVAPTTFAMTLLSSTSTLGNTYYAIDPTNGQIFLQNEPHGGIFIEIYNVTATNAVGQTSAAQTLTVGDL